MQKRQCSIYIVPIHILHQHDRKLSTKPW